MLQVKNENGGIYIHVPFCVRKCAYCDFYSCTSLGKIPQFVEALIHEINMVPEFSATVDTLYIGGGTPSLLTPDQIQTVIDRASNRFSLADASEITIEANPGTVDAIKLKGYFRAGINRINIGVQSFLDVNLEFLSRIHTAKEGLAAFDAAREAGFDNIGLDLIYGLPGQTRDQWRSDLQAAINLHPEHLSCYMLTYEPGTPMERELAGGRFQPLQDRTVGQLYEFTVGFLADNGYDQYEVSNFSTNLRIRSRHNQKYWHHLPYVGLGPSAHSFTGKQRSWNVRSLDTYLQKLGENLLPVEETEILDRNQLMMEALYLGLRCRKGILIPEFEKRFEIDFSQRFSSVLSRFESDGYLEMVDHHCRLTRNGMLFADGITARIIDAV